MSQERERYRQMYRFGSLERRGLAGGLRPTQVLVLGLACVMGVLVFRRLPNSGGIAISALLSLGACAIAWLPVAGRGVDEWIPVVFGWAVTRWSGTHRSLSPAPTEGTVVDVGGGEVRRPVPDPARAAGVRQRAVALASGGNVGVLVDRRGETSTAILAVRVRSFALLSAGDQERRLTRWGRAVASLARTGTTIRRVQILERTLPHDEDELRDWAASSVDPVMGKQRRVAGSYTALLDGAADVTQDHEVLVALQIAHRRIRSADVDAIVLREIRSFSDQLVGADAGVVGALSLEDCSRVLASGFDPFAHAEVRRPTATRAEWDLLRVDGVVHRTYWVAEWPRLEVGPAFLGPLLLTASAVRSISVVAEPVAPLRSRRAVEAALTSEEADEQLRQERGFRTSARRRQQHAAAARREAELSQGHEEVRFAAFVTVSGRDQSELERHCQEVLQAAQQAYLDLQPMWGQQDTGFRCGALPLCEGLAPAGLLDR